MNNLNFKLIYGSRYYSTPFKVKLRDFQLDRYPGSMSPSSYAAEVSIIDGLLESNHRIFMNNVLNYRGFRFFQSSYDKDEKGTILSVNHDWWGTLITYIGYFFLGIGFILVFLTKATRYRALSDKLTTTLPPSSISDNSINPGSSQFFLVIVRSWATSQSLLVR